MYRVTSKARAIGNSEPIHAIHMTPLVTVEKALNRPAIQSAANEEIGGCGLSGFPVQRGRAVSTKPARTAGT
jgi:hypothetical protein